VRWSVPIVPTAHRASAVTGLVTGSASGTQKGPTGPPCGGPRLSPSAPPVFHEYFVGLHFFFFLSIKRFW